MAKRINVVGAVLTQGTKVLAAQRGEDMSLAGMWEFPGGKMEQGETPQEALRRELQEELLCTAEIGEKVTTTEHDYDFRDLHPHDVLRHHRGLRAHAHRAC
ncbi:(deoxy)nucleoside triphosphate pyrophosphohydrolase [Corynebacterium variabile]|uniref:(deoxy)nucleoside triphosphate pyrophosphohydrolase n=1 Tax=Corynebacterium variabile TaxID=1727 RepID=UPI003FD1CDA5